MSTTLRSQHAPTAGVMSIAVIGPHKEHRCAVRSALAACQGNQIREFIAYPSRVEEASQMLMRNCDIVIVDIDSDTAVALDLVERICVYSPAVVMAYSANPDRDLMGRAMRAGAREFLSLPLTDQTMLEALIRASARRHPARTLRKPAAGLFVFLGSKGGTGTTTLACNFAVALSQNSAKRTLLIDLNFPLGDAAISLGIRSRYSTVDALRNSSRLDPNLLSGLLERHGSGLSVLAAPSDLVSFQPSYDAIDRLLEVARIEFDYVVLDAGSRLDLQKSAVFNESTTVYLVTQVGIPELRNANRLISQFSQEGGPKLEIVMNRYGAGAEGIPEAHVAKALTRSPEWKIPNGYAAVRRMQNTATPLALEDSPISRMIHEMAHVVCGKPAAPFRKKSFSLFR